MHKCCCDLCKIFHVRAKEDRNPSRCGFDRIVAPLRYQAAADKDRVGHSITTGQFADGVENEDWPLAVLGLAPCAAVEVVGVAQSNDFVSPFDISGCDEELQGRKCPAELLEYLEDGLFLAAMGRAADPERCGGVKAVGFLCLPVWRINRRVLNVLAGIEFEIAQSDDPISRNA